MVKITDKQLDLAIRMASQYCYEDDIAMMKSIDPKEYPIAENTRKKIERAIKKLERREQWEELRFKIPQPIKKIAVIVLVIGTLLFTGMMAIQPVRAAMVEAIIRWYNEYIGVLFVEDTAPTEIKEVIVSTNLPEEWDIVQLMQNAGEVEYVIVSPEGEQYRLSQLIIGNEEQWIDNENVIIKSVQISNNKNGILYEYQDQVLLIWKTDYAYMLRGEKSSIETLIRIASMMITP